MTYFIFLIFYAIRTLCIYYFMNSQIKNLRKINVISIIGICILVPIPYYLLSFFFKENTYSGVLNLIYIVFTDFILFSFILFFTLYKNRKMK